MLAIKKLSKYLSILFVGLLLIYLGFSLFNASLFLTYFHTGLFCLVGIFSFLTVHLIFSSLNKINILSLTLSIVALAPFLIFASSFFDVDLLESSWPLIITGILLQGLIAYLSLLGFFAKNKNVNNYAILGAFYTSLLIAFIIIITLLKLRAGELYFYAMIGLIPSYLLFVIAKISEKK